MKKKMLLSQFNYSILSSGLTVAGLSAPEMYSVSAHLPLTDIRVDFENGLFRMEADRNYIMNTNTKTGWYLYNYKAERIKVETVINPCGIIDLSKINAEGIILSIEGVIADDDSLKACYGLITVDLAESGDGLINNEWELSFYIYDAITPEYEIRIGLPLYSITTEAELN